MVHFSFNLNITFFTKIYFFSKSVSHYTQFLVQKKLHNFSDNLIPVILFDTDPSFNMVDN